MSWANLKALLVAYHGEEFAITECWVIGRTVAECVEYLRIQA